MDLTEQHSITAEDSKILFISSNFPPVIGGSAVVYDQLCRNARGRIVALGAANDYRTGEPWPDIEQKDADRGYMIHRVPLLRPAASGSEPRNWIERVCHALFRDLPIMLGVLGFVFALTLKYRVKVICLGELIYGGWLVFPIRYLLRRKVVIYTHGEEISQEIDNFLARRRGLFLRHADAIVAVSLFCKGQIISKYMIDPAKIHVINNGVDLKSYNRNGKDRSVWPRDIRDKKIILSVSRLVERKGQENLVRSMSEILRFHPDAHCVIVGGGPLQEVLKTLVGDLGIWSSCTIVGPAPHELVVEYFRNCDLFALPCRTLPDGDTEGFGLVFLEAGACAKPVVAGIAGGTIEAVADGETGLLVDGTRVADIAHAIIHLLSHPESARKMGEEGWRRAQGCNWPAVALKFVSVCEMTDTARILPSYDTSDSAFPKRLGLKTFPPQLLVTVDVEEQFGWDDFDAQRHSVNGIEALEQFHQDCRSIGVSPVYLLTYPILTDPGYRSFLRRVVAKNEAEAGIHLHSWTVPPYWEQPNAFTSYQCNLPDHVELRKLQILCETFEKCFGKQVTIHRAGRWGGSDRTSAILEKLGISLDLSPSTGYSDERAGGPNFSNIDGSPFWSGERSSVLTVPASSVNYLRGPRWFSSAAFSVVRSWPSLQSRARQGGKPVRFSPENADASTLFAMARELKLRQHPTAVYTLHSTSLYANGNPYSTGQGKAGELRATSLSFLTRAIGANLLVPTTCKDLLAYARSVRGGAT
jgi:glycosyltransferase involved in cell wall biosynthesis